MVFKKQKLQINLPEELKKILSLEKERTGNSEASLIRQALVEKYMDKNDK